MLYGLVMFTSSMLRSSDLHIKKYIKDIYGLDELRVRFVSALYSIIFIPSMLIGTIVFNKYSLKVGVIWGWVLQTLGAATKMLIQVHYTFLFIGQGMWAIAYAFIMLPPAMIAVAWFEDSKRVLAIAVWVSFSFFGIAEGYGFTELFINTDQQDDAVKQSQIFYSYLIQTWIVAGILMVVVLTFTSEPQYPPSSSATVYRDDDILGTYRTLFKNRQFMLLCFSHCFYYVAVTALWLNLRSISSPFGYSMHNSDLAELINVAWGVLGSLWLGYLLFKFKMYKTANIGIGIFTFLSLCCLVPAMYSSNEAFWVMLAIVGFFSFPVVTIWYIYAAEIAYPLKETTVTGIFISFGETISTGISYILFFEIDNTDGKNGSMLWIAIIWACVLMGVLCASFMRPVTPWEIESWEVVTGSFMKQKGLANYEKSETNMSTM